MFKDSVCVQDTLFCNMFSVFINFCGTRCLPNTKTCTAGLDGPTHPNPHGLSGCQNCRHFWGFGFHVKLLEKLAAIAWHRKMLPAAKSKFKVSRNTTFDASVRLVKECCGPRVRVENLKAIGGAKVL